MKTVSVAPRRAAALVAASLGLAAACSGARADSGVKACPGSPIPWPGGVPSVPTGIPEIDTFDAMQPQTTLRQLLPGTTRRTPGVAITGHRAGPVIVNRSTPFSFLAHDNQVVAGTLIQKVVDAQDGTCDYYYTVSMLASSAYAVDRVVIEQFLHPAHRLYGAWRNDGPPGIAPDHVERSVAPGDIVTFRIAAGVQPGQQSRPMLLDSDVGMTENTGALRVRAADGTLSDPIPAWIPQWP